MFKRDATALYSNRSVAFAVLAFAFAYGAGWGAAPDVTVLRSESTAFMPEIYSPMDAASPTAWRTPYPETVWTSGSPLLDETEADDTEFDL